VVVQPIGPIGADGLDGAGSQVDPGFVAAAFKLRVPLDESPVVVTPFGWHVLMLVERKARDGAAEPMDPQVVFRMRARGRLDDVVRVRRQNERVEIAEGVDTLLTRPTAAP
jgi:parvulin-like peptidyl-prolyl isomerase